MTHENIILNIVAGHERQCVCGMCKYFGNYPNILTTFNADAFDNPLNKKIYHKLQTNFWKTNKIDLMILSYKELLKLMEGLNDYADQLLRRTVTHKIERRETINDYTTNPSFRL